MADTSKPVSKPTDAYHTNFIEMGVGEYEDGSGYSLTVQGRTCKDGDHLTIKQGDDMVVIRMELVNALRDALWTASNAIKA